MVRFEQDLAGVGQELCAMRRWTVFGKIFPLLDIGFTSPQGKQLRLHVNCENWNEVAPAITLQNWDGTPIAIVPQPNIFHAGPHRNTGKPFVCMRGTGEYHTHESHLNDPWEALRNLPEFRLGEIVTQIWNGWSKANP